MATPKKPAAAITKHKSVSTKKTRGEAMDIIPAAKVMPTSTSRPVIAPVSSGQTDNTLTGAPGAPLVHRQMVVGPSGADASASKAADAQMEPDQTAAATPGVPDLPDLEVPAVLQETPKPAKPAEPGRSVADLLSARKQEAGTDVDGDGVTDDPAAEPSETVSEPETPQEVAPDVPPVLADKPVGEKTIQPPLHGDAKAEADTQDDAHDDTKASDDGADKAAVKETGPAKAAAADKPAESADSLHSIFATEEPPAPAEHSPQLKEAIAGLDSSKEGTHPHETPLFDGKPVIVVHEPHPVRSAVKVVLWFIFILLLALIALNFLLDAGVVSTGYDIPHTNLLEP